VLPVVINKPSSAAIFQVSSTGAGSAANELNDNKEEASAVHNNVDFIMYLCICKNIKKDVFVQRRV
jgi:hypothetical protein